MRPSLLVALLVVCTAAGGTAPAAPFTNHFVQVKAEVASRLLDLPQIPTKEEKKQKKVLQGVLRAIDATSTSLAKDVTLAKKITRSLDKAFEGDVVLVPMEVALADALQGDVAPLLTDPARFQVALSPGKKRTKIVGLIQSAVDASDAYAAAATAGEKLDLVGKELSSITKASKLMAKAFAKGPAVTTSEFDVDIDLGGAHLHAPPPQGPAPYLVVVDFVGDFVTVQVALAGTTTYLFTVRGQGMTLGKHDLVLEASTFSAMPSVPGPLPAIGGSMTITKLDPLNRLVAGTFEATFSDGSTTVEATNGEFTSIALDVH